MITIHASGEGDPPPARKRRWLLILLYVVAAIAVARALWLVPGQLAELRDFGYFEPYHRLPTGGDARLHGRVVEAWVGEPVAGVELEFVRVPAGEIHSDPDEVWGSSRTVRVRSGEDGRFDADVAPGLYRVSVDTEKYHAAPNARIFVGGHQQIPAEEIVVVHPLCDLVVKVVDDEGQPVGDAEVFIRGGDPGRAFYSRRPSGMTMTDARGEVHWRSWCGPATVRYVAIAGRSPAYVERQIRLQSERKVSTFTLDEIEAAPSKPTDPSTVTDERADDPSTLNLPGAPPAPDFANWESWGAVHAVVVDPQGEPVDAIVQFEIADPADRSDRHSWRFLPGTGFTRDGGRLTVEHLEPGRFRAVLITQDQPIQRLQVFTHDVEVDTDLGTVVAQAAGNAVAYGRVLGPDGPVAGAEVYLVATEDLGRLFYTVARLEWTPRTLTGPDGSFRLEPLPAGEVVLMAYHTGVGASLPTPVTATGELAVDLVLESGTTDRRAGATGGCASDLDLQGVVITQITGPSLARDAGLLPGDRLLYVDDVPVRWMERCRVYALLSGEERGLPQTVTVQRAGEPELLVLEWGGR